MPVNKDRLALFDTTEDQTLRIQKELAVKIGFNEAIILMQLEYLISISKHHLKDNWWTYQALEELREKYFPWWSIATISRALKSLEKQELIFIDNFNKRGGDQTRWYALNTEKIKELGIIKFNDKHPIFQFEKWLGINAQEEPEKAEIQPESEPEPVPILQNDEAIFHFARGILQNETTLPEITTETPTENQSPIGDSGKPPPSPNSSHPSGTNEQKKLLEPDTPETVLLFKKINQNRQADGKGPAKRFKSLEQKAKCLKAAERLGYDSFAAGLEIALGNGVVDRDHLVNWIAKYQNGVNNGYSGTDNYSQGKRGASDHPGQGPPGEELPEAARLSPARKAKLDRLTVGGRGPDRT